MEKIIFFKEAGQAVFTVPIENLCCLGELLNDDGHKDCYLVSQGKVIGLNQVPDPGSCYLICPRLRGGKGGFGSMLRAIGAQIEKTTNREACRDLSGRRMRDVNNEKKMVEYLEKKAEQEREREKKKMEKLERLTRKPKHFFSDPDYDNKLHEAVENVDKAVERGIIAHTNKRKLNQNGKHKEEPKLKKGLWLGEEDMSSGELDSEDDENAELRISVSRLESSSSEKPGTSSSGSSENEITSNSNTLVAKIAAEKPGTSSSGSSENEITSNSNTSVAKIAAEEPGTSSSWPSENEITSNSNTLVAKIAAEKPGTSSSGSPENEIKINSNTLVAKIAAEKPGTSSSGPSENEIASNSNTSITKIDGCNDIQSGSDLAGNNSSSDVEHASGPIETPEAELQTISSSANLEESKPQVESGGGDRIGHESSQAVDRVDTEVGASDSLTVCKPVTTEAIVDCSDVDLSKYDSAHELESLGLEVLKFFLMKKGVKCGGSLKERADRLFIVRDLAADKIDPRLLAVKGKKRNRSKK